MYHFNTGLPHNRDCYRIEYLGYTIEKMLGRPGFAVFGGHSSTWMYCFVPSLKECRQIIRCKILDSSFSQMLIPS